MLCVYLLYKEVAQSLYTYILSLPPTPIPPLGHHTAASWACCARQQLPTSHLFHTWGCIYVRAALQSLPPSSNPHIRSLCLCLYSHPANRFTCIVFLDSTCAGWRRKWQPTPVPLPGKSHGRRSPVGCSPWGCKELDMTEQLHFHYVIFIFLTDSTLYGRHPCLYKWPSLIPFMSKEYPIVYLYHNFSIHLSAPWGCLHILTIVNTAAVEHSGDKTDTTVMSRGSAIEWWGERNKESRPS